SSASSFSPVSTVETIGSGGLTPINVTDSQQLIRPLRAELRSNMGEDAKELEKEWKLERQIMTDHEDKAKPFEPKKKQSEDSVVKRNEKRRKLVETADQMISKLERIKKARKLLVDQKEGEDEQATAKIPRVGKFFEIGQLSEFAAANGLTVLNLDKFICATDKRKIIYNNNGVCIFCAVHGFTNSLEKHKNDKDCPFFFCTCANVILKIFLF
ncbi:DM domain-containing protein, partial [Meloidogyne graminicola]